MLDFWKAKSVKPTPLVIYIHGGGFRGGSKEELSVKAAGNLSVLDAFRRLLDAGISVAAVEYRLVPKHPLPAAHEDARRAIQFLRSRAREWNIDKTKVAAFGGSAGAQLCMYLAFHDDMADPASRDPVRRESTRLAFVATSGGQTTRDVGWWIQNLPGYTEAHRPEQEFFGSADPDKIRSIVADISALSLISADDPPIYMTYNMRPDDPPPADPNRVEGWRVHHVNFGIALKKKMDALGVEVNLKYPGVKSIYESAPDFFLAKFGRK
ncbi:MAG: alpha/beta hydrolase [Bryobacteraceae bacterium]